MLKLLVRFSLVATVAALVASAGAPAATYEEVLAQIVAEPYQPAYVPVGADSAFAPAVVPNTLPAQDYTTGSVPGNPDHPDWPATFQYVRYFSGDGAPLRARLALHPGFHSGVVVVHGFNTNGKESVIRWAAMLYANGYNVLASDQRDFKDEYANGDGYPAWRQSFGWKESTDVLAAGQFLKSQPGVTSVGAFGFSLGAQDTVLAMALDPLGQVFGAGLAFSGPGDQNAQIYSTAEPPGCQPPSCTYPATNALVALVVPPYGAGGKYDEPCEVLVDAGELYGTTPAAILGQLKGYRAQQGISVPLLTFYSQDDPLVEPFHATMMAGYEGGKPLQRTYLIQQGNHAYFYDRWWQQRAALLYFKGLLPGADADASVTTTPTVNQTPAGAPLSQQLVSLGNPTPQQADELAAVPVVCPGSPTAVTIDSFSARRAGSGVLLRWRTASEAGVLGFHVYGERAGRRVRLNRALVAASGLVGRPAGGYAYAFRARLGSGRFWLEEVRLDGSRRLRGPVRAGR